MLANPIAFWLNCAIWSQPWWLEVYAVVRPVEDWSQLPRIAIHHGIWRELMFSIRKSSTELNNASEPRWHFPSALSPEAHAELGLYKILEYMGLHEILPPGSGKNRAKLRKDIEEYLDMEEKLCVFLEYTRAMDTNEDWAEKKE